MEASTILFSFTTLSTSGNYLCLFNFTQDSLRKNNGGVFFDFFLFLYLNFWELDPFLGDS